jgi:hypothetical protein
MGGKWEGLLLKTELSTNGTTRFCLKAIVHERSSAHIS